MIDAKDAKEYSANTVNALPAETRLWSRSFVAMLVTQFTVALNDNVFRWLLIPIGKNLVASQLQQSADIARAVGSFVFLLPFILLAGWAGCISDRFSKRTVMIGAKFAEIVLMGLGVLAILSGNLVFLVIVLFLMGAQSAFFSPAKYGSIPEIVAPRYISAANGIIGLTTMGAVIIGGSLGNALYAVTTCVDAKLAAHLGCGPGQYRWWIHASVLLGVATTGWLASLLVRPLPPADPTRRIPWHPFVQAFRDLRELFRHPILWLTGVGSTYFWTLGLILQLTIDKLAVPELVGPQGQAFVGPMLAVLTLGIGLGSLLAGVWSHGTIERGLTSFGALGIMATSLAFALLPAGTGHWNSPPYYVACGLLFFLGCFAGLYDIPLIATLQYESPPEERGRILAAYNFLSFSGMLLGSAIFGLLASWLGLSSRQMFVAAGVLTFPVFLIIVVFTPVDTLRILFRWYFRLRYRWRVVGLENIPADGGAIIVSNHISFLDGIFIILSMPRAIRMIAHAKYVDSPLLRYLRPAAGVIAIVPGAKSVATGLREARRALEAGQLVGIFPEGGISRTGQIRGFQPGFLKVARGLNVPIIPVYIDGLWGSVFSFSGGRFFFKVPRLWARRVTVCIGKPLPACGSPLQAQLAVQELSGEAVRRQSARHMVPARRFLRIARRSPWQKKVADISGVELRSLSLVTTALALRRVLRREVFSSDEPNVGVLLPPSVGGVVVNAALALDRRTVVNLNYTLSSDLINHCIRTAGLKHVLTSRRVLERFSFDLQAEVICLEDVRPRIRLTDKLLSLAASLLVPSFVLERVLGLHTIDPDDVLAIIFTSGSTGKPKGVTLTHRNVGSNVAAFDQILHLRRADVLCGILPFFHSFGYTTTLWAALQLAPKVVYHYNPLEPRPVGSLCRKHGATILVATPTFLRAYIRRCEPEDFAALQVLITGAEKLPPEVADAFEQKFGIRPLEGYGTTELSPVVSANVPPGRIADSWFAPSKAGTVGRPIPGVAVKIRDLDTGEDLGIEQSGMLWVKGPNVMKGYLHEPEQTAQVIQDGWYCTGDLAKLDADGFITITGRLSRFSKIAGEMVPHLAVEEEIGKFEQSGETDVMTFAVTGVPDEKKGERLVVLYTELKHSPDAIVRALQDAKLPPLWIPTADSFYRVEAIPVLGTGKLDLKAIKELALSCFCAGAGQI